MLIIKGFRTAILAVSFRQSKPVVQQLYESVKTGNEAQISIDANSKPDYRVGLEKELAALHD